MLTTLAARSNLDGAIGSNQQSKEKARPLPREDGPHGTALMRAAVKLVGVLKLNFVVLSAYDECRIKELARAVSYRLAYVADFFTLLNQRFIGPPCIEVRVGNGFKQFMRQHGRGRIHEQPIGTGRGDLASRNVLVRLNREENMSDVVEYDTAMIGTKTERRRIIGRVANRGQVEAGVDTLRQEYVKDVAIAAIGNRQLRRRCVQDCEDVIQVEHIGLERLVDLDRRADWIAEICRSSHVLIGEVNESAVVQASEKARGIPPAGSRPRRAVKIHRILLSRGQNGSAMID